MLSLVLRHSLFARHTRLLGRVILRIFHAYSTKRQPPTAGGTTRTCVRGDLVQPLCLFLPVLALPSPSRHPRLALVVPYFLVAPLRVDALGAREAFPFGWGFRFGERLGARELCFWRWKLCEWPIGRRESRQAEERCEEELDAVSCGRLEICFAIVAMFFSKVKIRSHSKKRGGYS